MKVGEKIRKRRTELGMTMEDLGRAVGVQKSAINKYEKGTITDFKRSTIAALSKALDVPPTYLLDDDDRAIIRRATVSGVRTFRDASRRAFVAEVKTSLKESEEIKEALLTDSEARKMMKLWKVATPEGKRLAMDVLKVTNETKGR